MSALLDASPRWPAALGTTCVWVLAAASVIFWGLRLAAPPESTAPPALVSPPVAVDPAEVAKAFGATTAPLASLSPDAGNRFMLLGVVADDDQRGAALIAVDGKPARPFRVGQQLGDGYVLQSVDVRAAKLGAGPDTPTLLTLQMPKPATATGVMTASQRNAARSPPVIAPSAEAPAPAPSGTAASGGAAAAGAPAAVRGPVTAPR
jgi:general secretion pathway protein C